jgi:hypothetical protein
MHTHPDGTREMHPAPKATAEAFGRAFAPSIRDFLMLVGSLSASEISSAL